VAGLATGRGVKTQGEIMARGFSTLGSWAICITWLALIPVLIPLIAIVYSLSRLWTLVLLPFRAKPFDPITWNDENAKQRGARYWMVNDLLSKLDGKSREEVYQLLGYPDCGHDGYTSYEAPHYLQEGCYLFRFHGYHLKRCWPIGDYELLICLNDEGKVDWVKVICKWRA
jgi:hypothetical protein